MVRYIIVQMDRYAVKREPEVRLGIQNGRKYSKDAHQYVNRGKKHLSKY